MAKTTVTSQYKLEARTKGFGKAAKDVERLNQVQERSTRSTQNLGKASAATGRQFAAQASGLGGFVAAYAGAAANIFAVQQAFSALARAAQVETTIRGTRTLAAEIGLSGDAIISKLQEVTQGQLTAAEAAQNANIALSAGFNTDQIEELTEVATKASKALGRNLTESIQRVFRGAIKLEPELLDEIGIFTRIEPAVEKYAASLNRSVGSLTEFERRQAFANAVAEEGQRKFNDIDLSSSSAQKSLEQLSTKFLDLATKLGITLANFVEPFVAFLAKDFGNTLLVLGGIFALVFKGAGQQVATFTTTATAGLARTMGGLESLSRKFSGTSDNFIAATQKAKDAAAGFTGFGAFAGKRDVAAAATQAKRDVMTGSIGSVAEAKAAKDALRAQIVEERAFQKAVRASTREQEAKDAALDKSRGRTRALTAAVRELAAAEQQAGRASRFLAKSSRIASVAITAFGTAIAFTLSKLNLIFFAVTTIQGVFQLFGVDILGTVIEGFKKLGEKSRTTEAGLRGVASALESVNAQSIKLAGFDDLDEFFDRFSSKLKEIQEARVGDKGFLDYFPFIDNREIADFDTRVSKLKKEIAALNKEIAKGGGVASQDQTQSLLILQSVLETVENRFDDFGLVIGKASKELGLSEKVIAKNIKQLLAQGDVLKINGKELQIYGRFLGVAVDGQFELGKGGQTLVQAATRANDLGTKFKEAFDAGSLSGDKASKTVGGFNNVVLELKKAQALFKEMPNVFAAFAAGIAAIEKERDSLSDTTKEILQAEKDLKIFRDTFSKEIRSVDTAISQGILGIDGTLAKNAAEQQANRVKYLKESVDTFGVLNALQEKGEKLGSNQQRQFEQGQAALKAQAGIIIQLPGKLEKIRLVEEKRADDLARQTNALLDQVGLIALQQKLSNNKLLKERFTLDEKRIDNARLNLELLKLQNSENEKARKTQVELLKLDQDRLDTVADIRAARLEGSQNNQRFADEKALLAARSAVDAEAASSSQRQLDARLNLLRVENQNAVNDIERRKEATRLEFATKIEEIAREAELIAERNKNIDSRIKELKEQQQKELKNIIEPQRKLEDDKRANQRAGLVIQQEILTKQREIDLAKINAAEQAAIKEFEIVKARYDLLQGELTLANNYILSRKKIIEAETDILNQMLKAQGKQGRITVPDLITSLGIEDIDTSALDGYINTAEIGIAALFESQRKVANEQADLTKNELEAKIKLFNDVEGLITEERRLQNALRTATNDGVIKELEDQKILNDRKIENLAVELGLEEKLLRNALQNLDQEAQLQLKNHLAKMDQAKKENEMQERLALSLQNKIGGTLTGSVNSFFDALAEGTLTTKTFRDGVNDLFINLLNDIRQSFIDEMINEPIKNFVKDFVQDKVKPAMGNLFKKKSADGSADLTGAIGFEGQDLTGGQIESKGAEITSGISNIMENVKGTTIAAFGGVLAATGNFKTAIIAAFVEMFVRIMAEKAATAFALAASGGEIGRYGAVQRFAKGGPVNKLRDRVPALLEPGEFVIRKPAAKAIGGSALNQLNATGKMNSNPNVTVNVQNNGTPQEVETSTVRNDMGQLVIDLVVKDIQNNGRVRKAMRG